MSTKAKRAAVKDRLSKLDEIGIAGKILRSNIFTGVAWLRIPKFYRQEIDRIAHNLDITRNEALILNLDYELGGGCCTTAAVPSTKGSGYKMVRALDWEIPDVFVKGIKWAKLYEDVRYRKVAEYVGVVTAHNTKAKFAVALNQSDNPYKRVNICGLPITWCIREALKAPTMGKFISELLRSKPMVGGYVTVVGKDSAHWLEMTGSGGRVVKSTIFPTILCVCNDPKEGKEEKKSLKRWTKQGQPKGDIPFPVYNDLTVDLLAFKV